MLGAEAEAREEAALIIRKTGEYFGVIPQHCCLVKFDWPEGVVCLFFYNSSSDNSVKY